MRHRRIWFTSLVSLLISGAGWNLLITNKTNSFSGAEAQWVDSVFNSLTEDQKIGQLFMVRAHSNLGPEHIAQVENFIEKYHVGGLCFFQGSPEKQVQLLNQYQAHSTVPLMVAIDAEWGLGMRMKESTISFPQQLMLGAIQDNRLIYEMGKEIARELRRVGVQVNFAPVVDVNNNPKNPVINTRSFGEDRLNVSVKSYMYMQGLQDNGVMACAKHFPGHGDTDTDSHQDLPVIMHDGLRIDSVELYPFKVLSQHGVGSMMVAHLHVPSLDATVNLPTTLSRKVITSILKDKLRFKGLIFTDALEMKGVTKNFPCGEIEIRALEAGNDVLLLPEDPIVAFNEVKKAVETGRLSQSDIDNCVKKVLRAKYRLGLHNSPRISENDVLTDVNSENALSLKRKLVTNALTLVHNENGLLPFKNLSKKQFASLSIGGGNQLTPFQKSLELYTEIEHFQVGSTIYSDDKKTLLKKLGEKDVVIVSIQGMSKLAKNNFGITDGAINFLKELKEKTKVVVTVFGNPYSLRFFEDFEWLLAAYDDDEVTQELSAQGLFGAFGFRGRLPVTASEKIPYNTGETTTGIFRLGYGLPEEAGMNAATLAKIDDIANEAIRSGAAPGCVVLVAKDGKVVYNKGFGNHDYKNKETVRADDIYDLASITKVAATTLSVMKLADDGRLDVHRNLGAYLPDLRGTNKENLPVEDVLAHRAGLRSWIPFYEKTVSNDRRNPKPLPAIYSTKATLNFSVPVATNLFMREDYKKEIWKEILESEVFETKRYRYSDLGFYMLGETVARVSGQSLDEFATENFYAPLGMHTTLFNPWQRFTLERIPPTEEDNYFRKQTVRGYVHDMGAAMMGGVAGHAGLFASANDLAILMQMLLNKGYYGGERLLKTETVRQFTTRCGDCSRRGLGFDMKETSAKAGRNLPAAASANTFGHTGFTGTCMWADPDKNLVFIFLSNRTFPTMRNSKLNEKDIRERMFQVVYEALE